jgi:hypothetical protein
MKGDHFNQALDAIVAVTLILAFVYLGVAGTIEGQWAVIGLAGTGAGYGVWKARFGKGN